MAANVTLDQIIDMLWNHPEDAEWTPKIDTIPQTRFCNGWPAVTSKHLASSIPCSTIIGFAWNQNCPLDEYLKFVRHYYSRCFLENPDGERSHSRYSAGADLVNILAIHWSNPDVPKSVMGDWKQWLADIYKRGSDDVRKCIVQATLEHLLEQGALRRFFDDWLKDRS